MRRKMGEAAVRAAKAIGYTNAGTVEFMVDEYGDFYFLEVNTRLQVEHPVTEMIVHHDLVRAQVLVAAGQELPFSQEGLHQHGHAIECRVYAEDASRGFLPSIGILEHYAPAVGPNIRVDSGVATGSEVSVYYDPMLAKLIVWGGDRTEAAARMEWALARFAVLGVTTNIEFLLAVLQHPEFRAGRLHTQFLEANRIQCGNGDGVPDEALIAAALTLRSGFGASRRLETLDRVRQGLETGATAAGDGRISESGPWQAAGPWRAY
jgi:acetyl/propionyl-CoA carboxylase alpha subunit